MSFDAYHVDDATDAAIQKEIDAIFETCWSINHLTYIAAERVRMCGALVGRIQRGKFANVTIKGRKMWIGTKQTGLTTVTQTNALTCPWKVIATPVSNKGDRRWTR